MKGLLALCLGITSCAQIPRELLATAASGSHVRFFLQFASPMRVLDTVEVTRYATPDAKAQDLVRRLQQFSVDTLSELEEEMLCLSKAGSIRSINRYYISNTVAVVGDLRALRSLAGFARVQEVVSNHVEPAKKSMSFGPIKTIKWDIRSVNTKLDSVITGRAKYMQSDLRYGNADSGVRFTHPALVNNYAGNMGNESIDHNYSWFDGIREGNDLMCPLRSPEPCDDSDHGTATMSMAVGQNTVGMMPGAKWMACRNMDLLKGNTESYLRCLQFFLAPTDLQGNHPRPELRPHVLGNSYACTEEEKCYRKLFEAAVRALHLVDIFFVSATSKSGARGCNSINHPPAVSQYSFNVAGGDLLARASYSSLGLAPNCNYAIDITAPSTNVVGAKAQNGYGLLTGTSAACPIAAGAALILMHECLRLRRNPQAVKDALIQTAIPLFSKLSCGNDTPNSLPNNEFGFGVINLTSAITHCKATQHV
ncbi:hypothetical protein DSO57_1031100 [Entomophthora muscae]|uniref:Uncharacterized protein n=1 Tax=Entomophthora muscae TaxID=34485 RepID=A0ACC2RFD5_9FUNG|nr:hypothetical protein DSO57_1031100 [Entomophthora muscae]